MITRQTLLRILCVFTVIALTARTHAADEAPDSQDHAAAAATAFSSAIAAASEGDEAAAEASFRAAASLYASIADSTRSARARYNEGTAWLRAGDTGRAIVAFRRAERLGGAGDARLANNLARARSLVRTAIDAPPAARGPLTIIALSAPPALLAWSAALLFSSAWIAAALRASRAARIPWAIPAGAILIAAAATSAFIIADRARTDPSAAVLTAEETTARLGPDASLYEPSFTAPLTAGVEVRILDERPGWAMIELADGRQAWVPASSLERV